MKKGYLVWFFIGVLLLFNTAAIAQNNLQKIEIIKTFWGNQYFCEGKVLSIVQLEIQLMKVPETALEVKKARTNYIISSACGGVGGYLIGYTLGGQAAGNNNPQDNHISEGCIGIGVGVFFGNLANRHYEKAVEIYNSSIDTQ